MRRILARFWAWVARLWRREPRPLRVVPVGELPDRVEGGVIYVVGEGEFRWFVAMLCPCGCGETLHMNLQPETSPCWSLEEHPDGTASLSPSVWRKVGCRSHFFLCKGRIVWCD